ncbi:MAG TPA: hypothetical protein VMZ28_10375 [Kofleriaceae bacterium]|nr:hypothetical protein [Kofleriaceae bacterium]
MLRTGLALSLVVTTACADEAPPPPEFSAELALTYTIVAGDEPVDLNGDLDADVRSSAFVATDVTLRGERYRVPGFRCLRADGTPWAELPEASDGEGEEAQFEVLYPPDGVARTGLVFMPHGDGFEFIEAIALETYKAFPDTAELYGVNPEHGTRGVEQSTRWGATRNIVSTSLGRSAITLAQRGATVVMPGNCWGDGAHGMGESTDGYYDGRRLGGLFDHATWAWARANLDHDAGKAIAFGCSGGGHRIGEELIRDQQAFAAVVLDSPADNTAGFLEQPWGELIGFTYTLLRPELFDEIMGDFYGGTFGGLDAAADASLGHALPDLAVDAPIYLIYSSGDPAVTGPVVRDLADAVGARSAPSTVVELDIEYHCQLDFPENMAAATDWLAEVVDL